MIITQTPLRISFAGGGTDLPAYYTKKAGAVISSAIDKYVYVIINQRFDEKIVVGYMKKEVVNAVDEIKHELVREAMRKAGISKGVEVNIMADIPSKGSGLGSSSSLTVGLLNAFYAYSGVQVTAEQLAREACEIEIDICGRPIGKQDQYIAAYGGLRFLEFDPDGSVKVTALPLGAEKQELGARLMLFYTNITRKADSILKEQSDNTSVREEFLNRIRDLAFTAREFILQGRYDGIGEILKENWRLKKELAGGITKPEIEEMVGLAMQNGASGCKISGAGGGGFLLTCYPVERKKELREAMRDYRELPFFLERFGSKVIFNVEGYEWK